jgi:predicted flavoprotein YhiN
MRFDVIVVGGGAAGMFCAAEAGRRGRSVLVIEHAPKIGERIRISGGGRCNFTNREAGPANYLSQNPAFCRSALARFTPRDFVDRLGRRGIRWHEKTLGQLFCDESSQQVVDLLVDACADAGVRWAHPCAVHAVRRLAPGPGAGAGAGADARDGVGGAARGADGERAGAGGAPRFELATDHGTFRCASLVVATGGLAIPKLGASPFGYRLAGQFGLPVVPPKPALVPLALDPVALARLQPLSGVSLPAVTRLAGGPRGASFEEKVLVTHRGLSGPAVLQISSYWQMQDYGAGAAGARRGIEIDLLPGTDAGAWLAAVAANRVLLPNLLAERLPRRFAHAWCALHGWERPVAGMSRRDLAAVAAALQAWTVVPSGTLGFAKAEVTLGGVDTGALSSRTMEAIAVPGLYFIGEVVDVTGWLGGYNFQWAWSSGWVAGQYA